MKKKEVEMEVTTKLVMTLLKLGLFLLLVSPGIAGAQSGASVPDEWEFALTPFLWGSGMDGTVGLAGRDADFEASANDLIKQLDFAFMSNFEGRRNRWSFSIDFDYTDLGKDVTVENANVAAQNPRLDMKMTIVEGDVGYQVVNSLDFLAGVRRVSASAGLITDEATVTEVDGGFTDPIIGARFRRYLTEKLWVNLRGDVGGFGAGSDFSWFVSAAGGIRVSKLISLDFGYRIWDFDYDSANGLKSLDLALAGFGGGLTFHF
jgi:hypothetical protein